MGSIDQAPQHLQICLSATDHMGQPLSVMLATDEDRTRDRSDYHAAFKSTPQPGCDSSLETLSPHPILTDRSFVLRLKDFHEALVKAVVNIVERWWTDSTANLPARMPLEPPVEAVLQWIDERSRMKEMPEFKDRLGNWRPDFLLSNDGSGPIPKFQLCEINSRVPYNALIYSAYKNEIMQKSLGAESNLQPAGDFNEMVESLVGLFDADLPIHLVRGRDRLDRQEVIQLVEAKTGLRPRLVSLADLQLRPDPSSATGTSLYCRGSAILEEEVPEKVHQVVLSLFPDEVSLVAQDMLRQLALLTVHDFRTSLLVNDDRLLGIVLQELNDLVITHKVLTPSQARLIKECTVPTILPGSPELKQWVDRRHRAEVTKNGYILKAARQSRGFGHLLGDELTEEEWEVIMLNMQDPSIRAETTCFVLQPYMRQATFDIVAKEDKVENGIHMVGTYYTANGRFLGLGPWRSGRAKICNVHGSGCISLYSVTQAEMG
ncbi:hypothetical protein BDW59DRAFT_165566 [Aspergillus cavernicola]|uniref:Uncharacterized protein n=1 Tax=Aspergillus cavernicola TaxID=176166 RepID=A0ABR4HSX2_9EURO